MSDLLKEAFKELDSLKEDAFSLDKEGIFNLDDFLDKDEFKPDDIIVVDPEAEEVKEIKKDYTGKTILQCCVCESLIYKDPKEVIVDEDTQRANVEEECPVCGCLGGYKVVGQVAPFVDEKEVKVEVDGEEVPVEEKEEVVEEVKEPIKESVEKKDLETYFHDVEDGEGWVEMEKASMDTECDSEEIQEWVNKHPRVAYTLDFDGITVALTPTAPGYDVIAKELGLEESLDENVESKEDDKAGEDQTPVYDKVMKVLDKNLNESFEKATVETADSKLSMEADENGKVTVTSEPKEVEKSEEGMIVPVEDETKEVIEASPEELEEKEEEPVEEEPVEDEEIETDIEDFDEGSFDNLGESYLKEVYNNVESFKTSSGSIDGNKIKLEGYITFTSGNKAKTSFIFEAAEASKKGKVKFLGENTQLTKKRNAFTLTGNVKDKKLVLESLNYNYKTKDNDNNLISIYGTSRNK